MPSYRFFHLDLHGHFHGVEIIEAADDAEAVTQARELQARLHLLSFELWCGEIRVHVEHACEDGQGSGASAEALREES